MNPKHIVITIILLLALAGTASAWLPDFNHRMAITTNNGGASTLTNYPFNFTNDTDVLVAAGHMRASGADCRVTDASDNLIPFWNELPFNATGTKIWINGTLATGDNTFYMYYGNSSVSGVSDGDDTFLRYGMSGIRGFWKQDESSWTGAAGEVKDETTANNGSLTGTATTTGGLFGNAGNYSTVWEGVDCGTDNSLNLSTYSHGYNWTEKSSGGDEVILEFGVHNGKLYATTSDLAYLLEWDNVSAWTVVAPRYATSISLYGLVTYHGDLYVGSHSTAGGGGELLMWNGVDDWVLKAPQLNGENEIRCLQVYNDKIYGGTWDSARLFEWNGVDAWAEVAGNYDVSDKHIVDLIEFEDNLYGCAEPTGNLYRWNNVDAWVQVAAGIGKGVFPLAEYKGNLYGGTASDACLVEWNGVDAWVEVAPQYTPSGTIVRGLLVFEGALYGGIDGSGQLLKWNDVDAWELVCSQYATQSRIFALADYNGDLYGGSAFNGNLLRMEAGVSSLDNTHFSLETWMRPRELNRRQSLIDRHPNNYFLTTWTDNKLWFILRGMTDDNIYSTTAFTAGDLNRWHHIVCTYNGTHSNIYINGTLDNSEPTTGTLDVNDTTHFVLGFESAGINAFNGSMDETRVWSRDLDANEVELLYNNYMERMEGTYNIRKYSDPEPISSLGAEEDAPSGDNDITLAANTYGFLRKDVTAAQTFSTITTGFTNKICFSWLNNSGECWEAYWSGDAYNSDLSIPKHDAYFVLMDGTGETVSCGVRAAGNVAIPVGWYATYLGESTAKTLTQIKTDMQVDGTVTNLYTWDHNAGGTGAWVSVDVTPSHSVLPNQGILINNMGAPYNWDGTVS